MQQNPKAYYFLGLSYYNRGELELALSQFRKSLDLNPSFIQARALISMILLKQNRIDDSIMEAEKILQVDEKNALAHDILGSGYMAKGMTDEGMKELDIATSLDPKLVDVHLKEGFAKLAKGKSAEGETELETAVQVAPEILNTRFLLASYYIRQKNYDKAMNVLKAGVKGQKSDALLYNTMAGVLVAENKESEAIPLLQKSKETDPDLLAPYFNLALYYVSKKDTEKALGQYNEVLKRDPRNLSALTGSAKILESIGKKSEALSLYLKAKETNKAEGYLALAGYYERTKDLSKAIGVLDEAIRADSENMPAVIAKGKIYVEEKSYNEAIKTFDQVASKKPEQGFPLLISTYMAMGEGQKAVATAQKIINNQPGSADGYIVLASVLERQNDHARAIDTAVNGLRVAGENIQLRMLLAELYVKKHDYPKAMNNYDDVVKRNPKYLLAIFAQGNTLEMMGKKKDAVIKYRNVLSKSANFVPALNNLAYLYANGLGSKEEALRLATRAYELNPRNATVMDTMGYALLKNGKNDDARKLLEKTATVIPKNPSVQYHLALAYMAQGDKAQALKSIKRCLEAGDFPDAKAAKRLLAQLQT
jgi:tetratricopeptide (TPR) repeat protein